MKQIYQTYFKNYPLSTIQDFIKLLYQAVLGSAHLVVSVQDNYAYLLKEYESISYDENHVLYEEISEDLVRVHLEAIPKQHLKTMHTLFMKSVHVSASKDALFETFNEVEKGIEEGYIPFEMQEWQNAIKEYKKIGCPVVSHTPLFRENYHPHYRLMKKEYVKYLPLLFQMDCLEEKSCIAIDGHAASGKSTLALLLQDIYGYPIVHMDDFFLPKHLRTKERLSEIGGNVDYERFYKEVILKLQQKENFTYTIFDCSIMDFNGERNIDFNKHIIVEGSYAHHPYFKDYAQIKVFLDIDKNTQKDRILKRNGEKMLQRFIQEWIPMEHAYFDTFKIKENADIII